MKTITIALDAMGGDLGIPVTLPAAIDSLEAYPCLHIVLVGDSAALQEAMPKDAAARFGNRLSIRHTTEVVGMDESPVLALRHKKDSSMRRAIDLVKAHEADACVSAGNTGALMATARFVLKTLPGIDRPAICVAMPSAGGVVYMLDLGANVDCTAEQLLQFAVMGSAITTAVSGVQKPRVALLNIGIEDIKGNQLVQDAHQLMQKLSGPIEYVGFVEADEFYDAKVDVIVCDGFVGNVALKSVEGVARLIARFIKEEFSRSWLSMLAGLISRSVLSRAGKRIDPRAYNGASLVGLKGIVLKSHGSADRLATAYAIKQAYLQVEQDIPKRIEAGMHDWLGKGA
ncbi:MAG: phosphate acyltransferase PlsX [Gammaproteobacteria bacterium]